MSVALCVVLTVSVYECICVVLTISVYECTHVGCHSSEKPLPHWSRLHCKKLDVSSSYVINLQILTQF